MNTRQATDLAEISIIFARLSGEQVSAYRVATCVMRLNRLSREARTWAEHMCNYGESSEGDDSRKRDSISRRAFAAIAECMTVVGVKVEVHGDPRGSCLQIKLPNYPVIIRF